jgi:hypothetical protein
VVGCSPCLPLLPASLLLLLLLLRVAVHLPMMMCQLRCGDPGGESTRQSRHTLSYPDPEASPLLWMYAHPPAEQRRPCCAPDLASVFPRRAAPGCLGPSTAHPPPAAVQCGAWRRPAAPQRASAPLCGSFPTPPVAAQFLTTAGAPRRAQSSTPSALGPAQGTHGCGWRAGQTHTPVLSQTGLPLHLHPAGMDTQPDTSESGKDRDGHRTRAGESGEHRDGHRIRHR